LNAFCYTGGFSVYAITANAKLVDSIDISEKAMALTNENVTLNSSKDNHHSITANVLPFLSEETCPTYDIIIVDPPAFAKSLQKRHNAVQAYKRLNALALKKVRPGGLLFTFSCSQVVNTQLFYDTIVAAGIESGRNVRVVKHLSQGPDHPVNLYHPEGDYLKGLMLYVE
jgi:23S rRNA (cytosine1962-C5)-methyltransferase